MDYVKVTVTSHIIDTAREKTSAIKMEWAGNSMGLAQVTGNMWTYFKKHSPWPVKIIKKDYFRDIYIVARIDGFNKISFAYYYLKERVAILIWKMKAKILRSLMKYNLAYIPDGEIPSLCHIRRKKH